MRQILVWLMSYRYDLRNWWCGILADAGRLRDKRWQREWK